MLYFLIGLTIIAYAAVRIFRGLDLRLVLVLAALALSLDTSVGNVVQLLVAGGFTHAGVLDAILTPPLRIARVFLATFSEEKFVVPICLAMAFAYVLRETRCDEHLVQLMLKPLRHARGLYLPGTVLIGFVVNIPMISQGATAAAVGTVVIPLGRALGLAPAVIGAALVLGCSLGGELLNPAAPELRSVVEILRVTRPAIDTADCAAMIRPLIGNTFAHFDNRLLADEPPCENERIYSS